MQQNEKAILQTLCYSDIFDYPLTVGEIWKYLIVIPTKSKGRVEGSLSMDYLENRFLDYARNDKCKISFKNGYFCLKGREEIIHKRLKRKAISAKKNLLAKKISAILSYIPTVQFIGISGSLAVENAKVYEDIDFFVIAKKNTLWITRLFILFILEILRKRRKRNMRKVANKICVNLLMDESRLALPIRKQNLYTAHEIVQLQPLFERNNTYQKFIKANKWTVQFLPNFLSKKSPLLKSSIISLSFSFIISFLESFAKQLQYTMIAKHKTSEIVTDTFVAFHPRDCEKIILDTYHKKLRAHGI